VRYSRKPKWQRGRWPLWHQCRVGLFALSCICAPLHGAPKLLLTPSHYLFNAQTVYHLIDKFFCIEWEEEGSPRDVIPAKSVTEPDPASLRPGDACLALYNRKPYPAKVLKLGRSNLALTLPETSCKYNFRGVVVFSWPRLI
jgi:hypothetical protein